MNKIIYKKDGILIESEFISLSSIIKECNLKKIEEEKLLLLKMEWTSWRGFDGISEKIVLPLEKIEIIKKHILGQTIYFGEIAGKHSDVYNTLDENDIEVIDNSETILNFLTNNPTGHEYDHSFLYTFCDSAEDGVYEHLFKEDIEEFKNSF